MGEKGYRMAGLEIVFDPKKLTVVDTDKVKPNAYNPKQKDTKEYQRVKKGLETIGQRLPITVRTVKDGFEIIDGEQRWTACKELGFDKVLVYNEGEMSDKEAKELTIWYQQQVPFDEISLAHFITDFVAENPDYNLPYFDDEIQNFQSMASFDWDGAVSSESKDNEQDDELKTLVLKFEPEKHDMILEILNDIMTREKVTLEQAVEIVCLEHKERMH